jgi:RNA polymerase sigma factor (sigma-70 family)
MGLALRALSQKQAASERELVAAVRQGDDRAFEELFARYRGRITAYVLGMVRDHARAEDITQEVFLSALRRLRDTERPIAFKPWIYEIARNACIDEFRRARRTAEVSLHGDDDSSGPERNLVSKQPTPDAAMENKQRLEALRGAFRGLSENHHRILVMRELEGLSYAEIAQRLEMSRPMVESTLFRARRRLGEEYEDLTSGRRCQQVCEVVDRADSRSIKVLGVRARRQVAQHLSHCDDCRRYARLAGADEALFRAPTFADKVAALLPFGWLGRRLGARFIARQISGASHFVGSGAILGRVAAAVLMVAAAGGGYAGVSLNGGGRKTSATDAAAVIKAPSAARAAVAPSVSHSTSGGALSIGGAT